MNFARAIAMVTGVIKPRYNGEMIEAYQHLTLSGDIWGIADAQGRSAGREAQRLIAAGLISDPYPHHAPRASLAA